MKKIQNDIDTLSLREKEKILNEIKQGDLISLFKDHCSKNSEYKPVMAKAVALDQQLAITISEDEKQFIQRELRDIHRTSPQVTVSSYIRNKSLIQIDVAKWNELALEGIKRLSSKDYDERELRKKYTRYLKLLDNISELDEEDTESEVIYNNKLRDIEAKLAELKKAQPKRKYRLSGRTTFNEANLIRWRAARLSLTIADYVRFAIFDYEPNSFADKHLSANARKRFYVSILDVYRNGWGEPPTVNECPNCARYIKDIKALKEQLARYKALERAREY